MDLNARLFFSCWNAVVSTRRLSNLWPFSVSPVMLELKSAVEQRLGLKPVARTPTPVEVDAAEMGAGTLLDRTPTPTSTEVRGRGNTRPVFSIPKLFWNDSFVQMSGKSFRFHNLQPP